LVTGLQLNSNALVMLFIKHTAACDKAMKRSGRQASRSAHCPSSRRALAAARALQPGWMQMHIKGTMTRGRMNSSAGDAFALISSTVPAAAARLSPLWRKRSSTFVRRLS
jgi:hypothetical protein